MSQRALTSLRYTPRQVFEAAWLFSPLKRVEESRKHQEAASTKRQWCKAALQEDWMKNGVAVFHAVR